MDKSEMKLGWMAFAIMIVKASSTLLIYATGLYVCVYIYKHMICIYEFEKLKLNIFEEGNSAVGLKGQFPTSSISISQKIDLTILDLHFSPWGSILK